MIGKLLLYGRWPLILIAVIMILGGIQLITVNPPVPTQPQPEKFYTNSGPILEGNYTLPGRNYLAVRMDFNRRVKLTGRFRAAERKMLVSCIVLDAGNFELWKSGAKYLRLAETGYLPGGRINLVIEPGTYYLVLDNRNSNEDRPVEAYFNVD